MRDTSGIPLEYSRQIREHGHWYPLSLLQSQEHAAITANYRRSVDRVVGRVVEDLAYGGPGQSEPGG